MLDEPDARLSGLLVSLGGNQIGDSGRLQIEIDRQDAKASPGQDAGDIDQSHAAANAALERIKGDERCRSSISQGFGHGSIRQRTAARKRLVA